MRIPFCELAVELDIEGILEITKLELKEALNSHSSLKVECLLDEDFREQAVARTSKASSATIWQGEETVFFGFLYSAKTARKKGKWELDLVYLSGSYEMDVAKRSRVFYRQGESYKEIIDKVTALYPGILVRDEATGVKPSPGTLLQYEETDWQFLRRLASHFSTFLIPDTRAAEKRYYFGLPPIDRGQELWDYDYKIIQDMDRYHRFGMGMKQEYTSWQVRSPLWLCMGEHIRFNGTDSVVAEIRAFSRKGEILKEYTLSRPSGLAIKPEFNYEILGLSLPVTVIDRRDNQVQVEFDVNRPYPSEQPSLFYTYGIESSSFYCMPEVGSRAHVYFPNRQDWQAVAVHALNIDAGAGRNPDNKAFSSPTGAALEMTPSSYTFQSDFGGASVMHMGTDGNLTLTGKNITFSAGTSISVGEGKEATPDVQFQSKGKQLYKVGNSMMALESNLTLIADKAKLKAESSDQSARAQAVRDALTAGDEALRNSYNNPLAAACQPGSGGTSGSTAGNAPGGFSFPWDWIGKYKYKPGKTDNKTPAGWLDDKENEKYYKKPLHDNGNEDKIEKYRHTVSVASIGDSGNAFGKPKERKSDDGTLSMTATPGAWKYSANAYIGMTEENKKFGAGVQGAASIALVEITGKGQWGSEDYNLHVGGEVSALKAEAKGEAVVGYNKDGKFQLGAAGEAGAYMVEGSVSGGATVAGVGLNAKATGKIGFGLEGEIGWIDHKFKAKLGACFLFGGSVEFEIDFSNILPWT